MRKFISWMLALTMLLALAACGESPEAVPAKTPPEQPPTAEDLGREESQDMVFLVEGTEEIVPVTLWTGEGYSIYIPDEGWQLDAGADQEGVCTDTWTSTQDSAVSLQVVRLDGQTLEDARVWLEETASAYQLVEVQGGFRGQDAQMQNFLEVTFHSADGAVYGVLYRYPAEAAEGFGSRLDTLAGTFALSPA